MVFSTDIRYGEQIWVTAGVLKGGHYCVSDVDKGPLNSVPLRDPEADGTIQSSLITWLASSCTHPE